MTLDRRSLLVGGGGIVLGAAGMALMSARTNPGPGVAPRDPTADPFIPAEPGGPNAIGQLAIEGGGAPPTPRVAKSADAPRRIVVPFTLGSGAEDPAAGWPCIRAVGEWAVGQLDSNVATVDASGDPAVAAACVGAGTARTESRSRTVR